MKRAILLLALAGAVSARAQTGPVSLLLRLKAGQTQSYRITTDTTLKTTLPNGEAKSTNNHTVATFDLSVESVNPDGSYAVRVKRTSHQLTVDGETPDNVDVGEAEATAKLGTDGRYSGLSAASKPKPDGPSGASPEDFLSTVFDDEVGVPTRAVAVGERWKDQVKSPVDTDQNKVTVNSRLMAVDDVDGKRVARVLRVIAEPLHATGPDKNVSSEGVLEAGSFTSNDLGTGLTQDERDVLHLQMDMTATSPAGQTVKIGSDAHIRIHIEAIPAG
ncbi:MAG TPA: hypothetical protein VGM37_13705 [Armatimonadota bacterium]